MVFGIITLLTSFLIAGVAAYFSIAGLIAIFSGATLAVAVMAGSLELGKLVTASWLYRNWDRTGWVLKIYLSIAVFVLMIITSMGIFGYLSKAHMQQGTVSSDVEARVLIIDEKIKTERENIELSRNALNQLNAQVDARLSRSDDEKGAERAVQIRKQQTRERSALQKDIETAQAKIEKLNEERAPIATELRKVESEVGPIKYVAALIYGDNPDANLLERAVRWMIILLVTVFDPLAVALLIAANQTLGRHGINLEKDKTPGNNDGSKVNKSPGSSDDDTKPTSEAGTVGQNEDLQNTTQPPSSGDSLLLQQSGPTSDQPPEDNKLSGVEETTGQKKRSQSSKKKSNVSKKKIKPNQKKSLKRS
jgi:hypothetical protein